MCARGNDFESSGLLSYDPPGPRRTPAVFEPRCSARCCFACGRRGGCARDRIGSDRCGDRGSGFCRFGRNGCWCGCGCAGTGRTVARSAGAQGTREGEQRNDVGSVHGSIPFLSRAGWLTPARLSSLFFIVRRSVDGPSSACAGTSRTTVPTATIAQISALSSGLLPTRKGRSRETLRSGACRWHYARSFIFGWPP